MIRRLVFARLATLLFGAALWLASFVPMPAQAQGVDGVIVVASCGSLSLTPWSSGMPTLGVISVDTTGKTCVNSSASVSISGFTPNGNFANLTSTGSSASVALPSGTTVAFQNTGTTTVSCTVGVGSASATTNEIQVPASSTVFVTPGTNTFGACIDQSGSTSNVIVLAGGGGLGTGFGGGGGSSTAAPVPSASAESSHVFKGSAGSVYSSSATNLTSTAGFYVLIDAASAPADGAITPKACAPLPANGSASISYGELPGQFTTGIVGVVTSATTCFTKTTGVITAFLAGQVK